MSDHFTPRAIETEYHGYRFRSRLEARWAVFFNALGIVWEYEREGYDLGDAGRYLPDFWLSNYRAWFEVKPSRELVNAQAWEKMGALSKHTGSLVFCFYGCMPTKCIEIRNPKHTCGHRVWQPGCPSCDWHSIDETKWLGFGNYVAPDGDSDGLMAFGYCEKCRQVCLGHWGGHQVCTTDIKYDFQTACVGDGILFPNEHAYILGAFRAARAARFEFGEHGE